MLAGITAAVSGQRNRRQRRPHTVRSEEWAISAQLHAPTTALLSEPQRQLLARLTEGLDAAALHYISGYAAGLAAASAPTRPLIAAAPVAVDARKAAMVTVLYGSQTGNARREAERIHTELTAAGTDARLLRADAYPLRELAGERTLFLVISTQGEGEPPDDARALVDLLQSRRAPQLPGLRFAVLGLGDSSYAEFNAVARRLDQRLRALGAEALLPPALADTDIDTVAAPWRVQALASARRLQPAASRPSAVVSPLSAPVPTSETQTFLAEVLQNQRITARDSAQDVRHLELSLAGSGIDYQPGDALGVRPQNAPALVERVLGCLRLAGSESVRIGDEIRSLHDWLGGHRELTRLNPGFLRAVAGRAPTPALSALLEPGAQAALAAFMSSRQLDDVLREFPADWTAAELVAALRPLAPRLYSIASSRQAVGEEAHLTVAVVEQAGIDAPQRGVASGFLAEADEGATVPVYLHRNERFRLPADPDRDLIMIGPGTGVAPFRGFVQERAAAGARGRNWLFFGARHQHSQFLYQLEWQAALRAGEIDRLDLAFSRDQAERIHVSQRLREHGREVHAWLQDGAHVYVCGAIAVGRSVHTALRDLLVAHGGLDDEAAEAALAELQQAGRYARDVY